MSHLRRYYGPRSVPGKSELGGYVYVIQFATRLVKVGSTVNPKRRVANHHGSAVAYGSRIKGFWVSEPHAGFLDSEAKLKSIAQLAASETRRAEYFVGVDPEFLVSELLTWNRDPLVPVSPRVVDTTSDLWADIQGLTAMEGANTWTLREKIAVRTYLRRHHRRLAT
jgi:hypothetical protein